jgi:hypothetical protein
VRATHFYLGEAVSYTSAYLTPTTILAAATLLERARNVTVDDAVRRSHCDVASLTARYLAVLRYSEVVAPPHVRPSGAR